MMTARQLLKQLNFPIHVVSYEVLVHMLENPKRYSNMYYYYKDAGVPAYKAERSIRYAIEMSYFKSENAYKKILGFKDRPKLKEFIYTAREYLTHQ